jgi:hypothetical protein
MIAHAGRIEALRRGLMAGRFEATTVIDRPIEEVFAFLADGQNDKKFSARVLESRPKRPAELSKARYRDSGNQGSYHSQTPRVSSAARFGPQLPGA